MLSLSADHVAAFTLVAARGRPRPRSCCDLLFAPDEMARPGFDPSDAADFWDLVNRQDWAICEWCSGACRRAPTRSGWFAPMEDAEPRHPPLVLDRLGDGAGR